MHKDLYIGAASYLIQIYILVSQFEIIKFIAISMSIRIAGS